MPKPWLDINCDELNCRELTADSIVANGRIVQEQKDGGRLTPYTVWRGLNTTNVSGNTLLFAMGSYIGNNLILAGECYNGMAVKVKLCGSMTNVNVGVQSTTLSIRNLDGSVTYGSITISSSTATDRAFTAEFNLQILQTGAAGVGVLSFGASSLLDSLSTGVVSVSSINNTTFDSTAGLNFYVYGQNSSTDVTTTLKMRYCVLEA